MAKVQNPSRYATIVEQSSRRRESMQKAISRSDTVRSAMVSNITSSASNQVTLTEQLLRTRSATAAKARLAALNKLA